MKFLLPQGIGDSVWALHKIKSAASNMGADSIEVYLNCAPPFNEVQERARDFVKKFSFVSSCEMLNIAIHDYGRCIDDDGHYIYIPDGWTSPLYSNEQFYAMMPNGPLERGVRLEDWLPEFAVDWNTSKHFQFLPDDLNFAERLEKEIGPYCVFYLGPMRGNSLEGHNRGPLWTNKDWATLGKEVQERTGLKIVVVGAWYDADYWEAIMRPTLESEDNQPMWREFIGDWKIGRTFAVCKRSKFVIAYQSGIGIFSCYLRVPTAIWWRPKGNSISPDTYLSFEEEMSHIWVSPDMLENRKYMPLIYDRHSPFYISSQIVEREWYK